MVIKTYPLGEYGANCYLVINDKNRKGIVIDPGANGAGLIKEIEKLTYNIKGILLTHAHFDHIGGVKELKDKYNIPVYVNQGEIDNSKVDNNVYSKLPNDCSLINDGDVLNIGGINIKCLHTPGHSKGGMCFLIEDSVFTGDTLFQGSIGRTDFISGDFKTLIDSIQKKLITLDGDTKVYPGHGPSSTIMYERMRNPFLH